MDFPKKQAQRLMPLYLLEYSEKLFENHPNPEDPWGGGSDYTAGYGIDITNDQISIDQDIVATKNELNGYIKDNDTNYSAVFRGKGVWVKAEGAYTATSYGDGAIARSIPNQPGYTYDLPNQSGTIALTSDIPSLSGYATEEWVQNQGYITSAALTNYVTTTMLEDALDDYALKTDIPENVSDLNNDAGYTTQTWVENQGYLTSSDLSDYVTSSELSNQLSNYALSSTVTGIASQVTTLESLVSNHTTQINSINSNITDLQTLTSTHTSQISGINSSVTSLESLVNTNISSISTIQNNLNSLGSQVTTLEGLVSTNTSNISAIQSAISDMDNHPFYRVTDSNSLMYFDWDGTDPFYKRYDISDITRVRLNALNPNYGSGLIASYNSNTYALDISVDENIIPSIIPNYPQEPVQTLSTLRVNGVVYGIPSGGANYSAGTGIDITNNTISLTSAITSSITTLEGLTSTHTSQISALQSSVSNCVTVSQLSSTLSDYALKSEVPSVVANPATTTQTLSALQINGVGYSIAGGGGGHTYSLSKTFETWTFTLSDNTTITKSMLMDVTLIES